VSCVRVCCTSAVCLMRVHPVAGKNVMLLPVGRSDDGAHSQNEKLDKVNYINGIKLLGSYVNEFAKLSASA